MNYIKRHGRVIIIFLAVFALGGLLKDSDFIANIDHKLLDEAYAVSRAQFPQAVRNDVVVVGIDEKFLRKIDTPVALSHVYLAAFLRAVASAKPQAIGLDVTLPEKRFDQFMLRGQQDINLHQILVRGLLTTAQTTPIIAAKAWDYDLGHFRDIQVDFASVLEMQGNSVQSHASALLCPDSDGRIRAYPGKTCQPDGRNQSLSSELAAVSGIRQEWSGLINYRLGAIYSYVPIDDVLRLGETENSAGLAKLFAGKIVLLGTVLDDTDLLDIPVPLVQWRPDSRRVPGVFVHAQILRSMLNDGFVRPVPNSIILALCLVCALFCFGRSSGKKLTLWLVFCAGALLFAGALLLQNIWLPATVVLFTASAAFSARAFYDGMYRFQDKKLLGGIFSGYVSTGVMRKILNGEIAATKRLKRGHICCMLVAIRGFEEICEKSSERELETLLNRYFDIVTTAVHHHDGTVDKLSGDCIMVFFGAPNTLVCPEKNAMEAAHDIQLALEGWNREVGNGGDSAIQIQAILHNGEAIVGQIGSAQRREYGILGDTVHKTSLLQEASKKMDWEIICSDAVAKALQYPAMLHRMEAESGVFPLGLAAFGWNPVKRHS